jgi:alkylation response protein AidB-like acyl-CoA dehydrogenase
MTVDFRFDEDQARFRDSVRAMLAKECSPERLRALSTSESARSAELWKQIAELGLTGLLVPEEHGGLGLGEVDFVLALEEAGRAALAEPLAETAAVAAPLLAAIDSKALAAEWLPAVAAGEATIAVGHPNNAFIADAHVAKLLLLERDGEIHAIPPAQAKLTHQPSIDPLRRIFSVDWQATAATRVASGATAKRALAAAFDRGAWATAAEQIGVADALVAAAVAYACQRQQFGQVIGSFQALKHMLANVTVRIEYAKPVVHRAAFAIAQVLPERDVACSHAKAAASEAAAMAAKAALQVHGAIGYTWEVDLHLWMKRAWSLDHSWGSAAIHRARIAERVLDGAGPAASFGFRARQESRQEN